MKFNHECLAPALSDVTQTLHEAVPELWISISALHRYLAHKCKLTLKKLEGLFATRERDRILQREKVEEKEALVLDLDLAKNCMFIDEAGFNLHTQRSYDRSRKGTPAKGLVSTPKDITSTGS
jgi:hypothetical protein